MPRQTSDPRENRANAKKRKGDPAKGKSGRPRKTKTKAKRRKAAPSTAVATTKANTPKRFKWTPLKRRALKYIIQGKTINYIADATGKHRNTIRRWMQDPVFVQELMQRLEEFKNTKRFRRLQMTSKTLDRIEKIVLDQFKAREEGGVEWDDDGMATLFDADTLTGWLKEWRAMRAEERKDFGDHVDRVEKKVGINISGGIGVLGLHKHQHEHTVTLSEALQKAFPNGGTVEGRNIQEATGNLLAKAVVSTGIIDQIIEEDVAVMEAGG